MIALAWRNLWRQGRRSPISLLAVALVVLFATVMYSFGGATINSMYGDLTQEVGNAQIRPEGYRDARDFDDGLLNSASSLRATVAQTVPDAVVVGALQVPGLVAGEDRSRGLAVQGQDWPDLLRENFVTDHLADSSLGDDVYAPGTDGYGAAAYTVEGLLDFADPNQEISAAYLSLPAAQELAAPDGLSRLELHFPGVNILTQDAQAVAELTELRSALPQGAAVETWQQLDPSLATLAGLITPVLVVVSLIFFVLAGLLVLNTVYLSTLERVREFGIMISLGARGRQIMGMVTLESVLLCLSGAQAGQTRFCFSGL